MDKDFSKEPLTLSEARAHRAHDAKRWTPRDVLISALRDLDAGVIKPDALIVAYNTRVDDDDKTGYKVSSPNFLTSLGLISRVIHIMNADP